MATEVGATVADDAGGSSTAEEATNRLEYLADLLLDLQSLAGRTGGPTLSGLLALAAAEAQLQAQARSGQMSPAKPEMT